MTVTPTRTAEVAIVGGGAAGMAAAVALARRDIVLLEQEDRLGGRLHSLERGRHWINLGAHLLTGGPSAITELTGQQGLAVRRIPGITSGLWFGDRLHRRRRVESYPVVLPLGVRQRLALVALGLRVRWLAARWSRVIRPNPGETPEQQRVRLRGHDAGRTFAEVLAGHEPLVSEIFRTAARRSGAEADQITAGGAGALFGALWAHEGGSSVVNIDGGSGRLGSAVRSALGDRAVLRAEVTEVVEGPDGVHLTYLRDGEVRRIVADRAIVATTAGTAARLVRDLPSDVAAELAGVVYGSFVCLGMLTEDLPDVPWDDVYAIAGPGTSFDMLFNHSNPFRTKGAGPGRRSLMAYVGGRRAVELLALNDAEIRAILLRDVERVLPELAGAVHEAVVQRWPVGNSVPTPSTRLDRTEEWNVRPGGRLVLAGDFFAPLGGTIEAATLSGRRAAELVAHGRKARR